MGKCCYSAMFPKTVCLSLLGIVVSLTLILTDVLDVDRVMAFNKPDSQSAIDMKTTWNTFVSKSTPELPIIEVREFNIQVASKENVIKEDTPLITKRSIDPTKEAMPKPDDKIPSKEMDNEQSKESATKDEYDPSKEVNAVLNLNDRSKEVNSSKIIDRQSKESTGTEKVKPLSTERTMEKYNANLNPLIELSNNESLREVNISLTKLINPNTVNLDINIVSNNSDIEQVSNSESSKNVSQIIPNSSTESANNSILAAAGINFEKSLISSFQYEDEDKVDFSEFDSPMNDTNGNSSPNHESPSDGSMDSETGVVVIDYFLEDSSSQNTQNHISLLKKENESILNTFTPNSTITSTSATPLDSSKDKIVLSQTRSKREIKHKRQKRKRNNNKRKFKKLRKFKKPFVTQKERTRKAKNKLQKKIDKFIEVQGLTGENQTRFLERLIAKIDNLTKLQLWNSTRKFKNFSPSDKKINAPKHKAMTNVTHFVGSEIIHFSKKVSSHRVAESELDSKNITNNTSSSFQKIVINSDLLKPVPLKSDQPELDIKKKNNIEPGLSTSSLTQTDVLKLELQPNNKNQSTSEIVLSSSKSEENDVETHLIIAPTDTGETEDNLVKSSTVNINENSTHFDTTNSITETSTITNTTVNTKTANITTKTAFDSTETTTIAIILESKQALSKIGNKNTMANEIESTDISKQNSLPVGYMNPLYDRLIDSNQNGKVMVMLWDQNLGKGKIISNPKTFMEKPSQTEDKQIYSEPIEPLEEEQDEEIYEENKQNDHNIYKRETKSTDNTSLLKKSVSWIQVNSNVSGFSGKKTDHKKNLKPNNVQKNSTNSRKFFKRVEFKSNNNNIHKVKKVSGFKNQIKNVRNKRDISFHTLNENNENLFFSEEVNVSNPDHVDKNVFMNRPIRQSDFDVEGDPYVVSRTNYNPYNLNGDIRQSHFYTTLVKPRNYNKVRTSSESLIFKKLYQHQYEPDLATYLNRPEPVKGMNVNFYNEEPNQDQTFDYVRNHPYGNSSNNTTDNYNRSFIAVDSNITAQCQNNKSSTDGHILVQGFFNNNEPGIGDLQITVKFKPCNNSSPVSLKQTKISPNKTVEKGISDDILFKQTALKNLNQATLENTNYTNPFFDKLKVSPLPSHQEKNNQNSADANSKNFIDNSFESLNTPISQPVDVTSKQTHIIKALRYYFDRHKAALEHKNQRHVTNTKDCDELHKLLLNDYSDIVDSSIPTTTTSNEKRVLNITSLPEQLKQTEAKTKKVDISGWVNMTEIDLKFRTMNSKIYENNSILRLLLLLMTKLTQDHLHEKHSLNYQNHLKLHDQHSTKEHLQRYFPLEFKNEKGEEKIKKYFYDAKRIPSSYHNPEKLNRTNVDEDLQRNVGVDTNHSAPKAINAFTNILYNKYVQSNVTYDNLKDRNNRGTSFEIINIIPNLYGNITKASNDSQLKIGTFIKIEENINNGNDINYTHSNLDSNPIIVKDELIATTENHIGGIYNPNPKETGSKIIPLIAVYDLDHSNFTISLLNESVIAKTHRSDDKSMAVNQTQTPKKRDSLIPIIRKQEDIRADETVWDDSSPDINVSELNMSHNKQNGSEILANERESLSLLSEAAGFNLTLQEKTDTLLNALEKSLNASREVSNEVSDKFTNKNLNPVLIRNSTSIVK